MESRIVQQVNSDVRERIFSFIIPPAAPPLRIILQDYQKPHHVLPPQLLVLVEKSPPISEQLAFVLGPRAQFLNQQVAKPDLHKWIAVLNPPPKAVSLWDDAIYEYGVNEFNRDPLTPSLVTRDVIRVLCAIADRSDLNLQLLDIADCPLENLQQRERIQQTLVRALRANSHSLAHLAIRADQICLNALKAVPCRQLCALRHLRITVGCSSFSADESNAGFGVELADFLALIATNLGNGVSELWLENVSSAPVRSVQDFYDCSTFFDAIKVLRMDICTTVTGGVAWENMQLFVGLFRNLEQLHWDGRFDVGALEVILAVCDRLQEVHWKPMKKYTDNAVAIANEDAEDSGKLPKMLEILGSRLVTLEVSTWLSTDIVDSLHGNCSNLQRVEVEIGRGNIHLVGELLKRNEKIRVLHLTFPNTGNGDEEALGEDGWKKFVLGISCASGRLEQVKILNGSEFYPAELALGAVVEAIETTMAAMGSRAKAVRFDVPVVVKSFAVAFTMLRRILDKARECCDGLERLELNLKKGDVAHTWSEENEENEREEKSRALATAMEQLKKAAPRLHLLQLRGFEEEMQRGGGTGSDGSDSDSSGF